MSGHAISRFYNLQMRHKILHPYPRQYAAGKEKVVYHFKKTAGKILSIHHRM